MVWLHVKRGGGGSAEDSTEFLLETTCDRGVEDLCTEITTICNKVTTLEFLVQNLRSLSKYGPMLPEDKRGLADDDEKAECPDPDRIRIGSPPHPDSIATLQKVAVDVEAIISKDRLAAKVALSMESIEECEQLVKGAIMIAYPMALPKHDVLQQWMNNSLDFSGGYMEKKILEVGKSCLWFAGKKWSSDQAISKYLGHNEKTKVIVRLQRISSGAPVREPGVDRETHKKMMAYYHKKQEQQKKLEEDSSDSYLKSMWSDPHQMKKHFNGTGNIKWRPGL